MQVPNRYHHSKKDQKRHLKPQALRQAKARRQALKKRLNSRDASFFINIDNLNKFCKENKLTTTRMRSVIIGINTHHKGWTAVTVKELSK